jgi:hypothetical protein
MAKIDVHSPDWREVDARLREAIENARDALERQAKDHEATTLLRGKIAAYRDVLTWPEHGRTTGPTEGNEQ